MLNMSVKSVTSMLLAVLLIASIIPINGMASNEEEPDFNNAKIGDIVQFGHYEQDSNANNGPETVEWIVIDKNSNQLLLLSKNILDAKPYHKSKSSVKWEDCSLREWMNTTFYDELFSETERSYISTTVVENEDMSTEDALFLLSAEEVEQYLDEKQSKCTATKYARVTCGVDYNHSDYYSPWLLRTIGKNGNPMNVQTDGTILTDGTTNIYRSDRGIRPALWVSASNQKKLDIENTPNDSSTYEIQTDTGLSVGDTVVFGTYNQDLNSKNGNEDLEWIVLDIKDGEALLITKLCLDQVQYNEDNTDVTWETCSLRSWLNDEFYENYFSDNEKSKILSTKLTNPNNSVFNTDGGNDTEDKVFILSETEADEYFDSDTEKCAGHISLKHVRRNENTNWWLRTPGLEQTFAEVITDDGEIFFGGFPICESFDVTVRPCIKVVVSAFSDGGDEPTYVEYNENSAENSDVVDEGNTDIIDDISNSESWYGISQIAMGDDYILGLKSDGTVSAAGKLPEWLDVSSWNNIKQLVTNDISSGYVAGLKNDGTIVVASDTSNLSEEVKKWSGVSKLSGGRGNVISLCGFCDQSASYFETGGDYWYSARIFGDSLKDVYYGQFATMGVIDNNNVALFDKDGSFWGISVDVAALGEDVVLHTDGTVEMLRNYNDGTDQWKNIKTIATCMLDEYPAIAVVGIDVNNKLYLNTSAEKLFGKINISGAKSATISKEWLVVLHVDGTISTYNAEELDSSAFEDEYLESERFYLENEDRYGNRFRSYMSNDKQMLELIDLRQDGTYVKAYFNLNVRSEYREEYGNQELKTWVLKLETYEKGTYSYEKGNSYRNGTFTLSGDNNIIYKDEDFNALFSLCVPYDS